ncbi:rhamnan synthesis F family protein [Tabrizicola sp.]|uniref:rhamnan synthesis F family protein n=1 Tax=Tabrizicola sp. TaxID=2005166 RepID=UPI0025ED3EAC|nr:rhamnan synthesis F family protein [Tabrizicola sp.]
MIPGWKIRRELDRASQRLRAAVGKLYEPLIQRAYDRKRTSVVKVHQGGVPLTDRIALVLTYQPKGFAASLLKTCAHLRAKGYAPLVVCNAPATEADLRILAPETWAILLRPNYGYDFGGYRDGILHLRDSGVAPRFLIILNDSIWYPLNDADTLIERMEATGFGLTGAILQEGDQGKAPRSSRYKDYIESFFYLISSECYKSQAFTQFWTYFPMSNLKFNAVYAGERRFSRVLEESGQSVGCVLTRSDMLSCLQSQSAEFLRKTLTYAAYTDPLFEKEGAMILADFGTDEMWRRRALAHVAAVSRRRHFHASFCYASVMLLNVPFLKKTSGTILGRSYGMLHLKSREQYLRAVGSEDLPRPSSTVLSELQASVRGELLASH